MWLWNLFYSKVTARSVITFIPLGDETVNSSLVERGRSLMDLQPHPLLHICRPIETDVLECISWGRQKCGSHKGKDLGCTEDVVVFSSQISESYPSPDWQYGDGRRHAKGWFRPTVLHGDLTLWRVAAPSLTKIRTTLSVLLSLPPFPILDEHTLH